MQLSSRQMLNAIDEALAEVSRRLASGELDHSGRYYSDAELRQQVSALNPKRRGKSSRRARTSSVRRQK